MADVARVAEVNRVTVSRALSNPELVAPETLSRIQLAIARTGYIPDQIARGMKARKSRIVSLVTPPQMSGVYGATLEKLSDRLRRSGLIVNLFPVHDEPGEQEDILRELAGWRPAAIVVFGAQLTESSEQTLRDARVPVVELLAYSPDSSGTCVGYDHVAAARLLTRHLLDRGYRKIGYVHSGRLIGTLNRNRVQGFADAISDLRGTLHLQQRDSDSDSDNDIDIKSDINSSGDRGSRSNAIEALLSVLPQQRITGIELLSEPTYQGGYDLMQRVSGWTEPPEALLFGSDMVAVGALQYCIEHGLHPPDDIGLCAFDGIALTSLLRPRLTCLDFAYEKVIDEGARLIVDRADDGSLQGQRIRIPVALLHREST